MSDSKKLNYVFNNSKDYCLVFTFTKQFSVSNYMTVVKIFHIKSWKRLFRWGYILKFRLPNLYTIIIVAKGFLNRKERVKGFFIFMSMLSFKQVESNKDKEEPCKRGSSWIMFSHFYLIVTLLKEGLQFLHKNKLKTKSCSWVCSNV